MQTQAKLMIVFNLLFGLMYAFSSFQLWDYVNSWLHISIASRWSAFNVHFTFVGSGMPPPMAKFYDQLNAPFILFWVILAINLYFIFRLQRSKETKPV
jgi:hypothetical protein